MMGGMTQDDANVTGADGSSDQRKDNHPDTRNSEAERVEREINDQPSVSPGKWVKRIVGLIVLVALGYVAYKIAAAYFPRWWAQQIGDLVQGRVSYGTMWGLFFGFTFTFIPLLLLFQIRRRFLNWLWRGIIAVIAIALALPNWLTLAVVAGNSNAAHAGERIFDVEGVGFRNASLVGVIAGAVVAFIILFISLRLSGRKKKVKKLEAERDELRRERDERDAEKQ